MTTGSVDLELAALSAWIDNHPANLARDPESRLWGRLAKIQEEAGEVIAATIGATGQNPRKGVTHTLDDVAKEVLDVAVTALCAYEHLKGNDASCMQALRAHVAALVERAGIAAAGHPQTGSAARSAGPARS